MSLAPFLRDNAPFLAAGALLTFTSSFGQTYFIALFAGEIQSTFGLSHGAWGAIYAAATTASALAMIWAGVLTDRFRVRALGTVVLAGLSLACLTMAVLPSVWLLPICIFLLRFFGQGMVSHTAVVAIARWFVRTRGRALSIASTGFAAGEALLPLVFVAALSAVDWRLLWLVAALIPLVVLPVVVRLLRQERTPQAVAEESQAAGLSDLHWTRSEVLRHWLFWLVVPAMLGPPAFGTAFFFLQVHTAEVKGWSHVELVALFPIYTLVSIAAMLASGWLIDRIGTGRLMPLHQLPMAAGFLVFGWAGSLALGGVGIALMAATHGAMMTVRAAFWAEFYGTRHIGAIKALAAAIMVFGTALGPGLTGALIDAGIDFPEQMTGIAAYFVVASALTALGVARASTELPPRVAHP